MFFSSFDIEEIITTDKYLNITQDKRDIQYIKLDVLKNGSQIIWRDRIHPESINLYKTRILITGHSDYAVDDELYKKYSNLCDFWMGVNMDTKNGIKLPLGITNDTNESYEHKLYGNLNIMKSVSLEERSKSNLIYMNFNINTYKSERQMVYDIFKDKPFVKIGKIENNINGRTNFLRDIKESKFVLCPRGNGIDTHRLWETLYMGSIPIVRMENAYSDFTDLPILFVNDWKDLSDKDQSYFNEIYYKFIHQRSWNLDKLKISYWKKKILSLLSVPERYFIHYYDNTGERKFSEKGINRIITEVKKYNSMMKCITYSKNDLPEKFLQDYSKHFEYKRGAGYWYWKPKIIRMTLDKMKDGDELLYCDTGCEIKSNLNSLFDLLLKQDIIPFQLTDYHPDKKWTKYDLIKFINSSKEDIESHQITATYILLKKTDRVIKLIDEWLIIGGILHNIDDSKSESKNDDMFIEHRHDQSIWSLLIKKYNYKVKDDISWPLHSANIISASRLIE